MWYEVVNSGLKKSTNAEITVDEKAVVLGVLSLCKLRALQR